MSSVPETQDRPLNYTTVTIILTQAQNPALVMYLEQVFVSLCVFLYRSLWPKLTELLLFLLLPTPCWDQAGTNYPSPPTLVYRSFLFVSLFSLIKTEPRALCMLGKH